MSEIEKAIEGVNFFKNTDFGGLLKARELLEELQEREKGCEYCNTKRIQSAIGFKQFKYCPLCDRKLGENNG